MGNSGPNARVSAFLQLEVFPRRGKGGDHLGQLFHHALVVVLVCALTDAVLAVAVANLPGLGLEVNGVVLPVVLVWYIFTELGSIAENAAAMGAPVPGWLVRILAQGKEGAEK